MNEGINKDSTNVLIIGKSGVGKSSLLNYMFGRELQKVGVGAPVTKMEIKEFTYKYDEHFEMHIFDTWGLEPSVQKADEWKKKIFDQIEVHDSMKISDWFNTIIFCLNAKSARVEDFEIDIMEKLLGEKNHVTIALTHCNSKSDPDGIVLRDSVKEELAKRGIDSIDDRNFVFVSNVRKALLGGAVEQFGREEIFISIIRNVWASLKSKVPYQARKRFESLFALKKSELLKKPDRLKWIVPFMKKNQIKALEREINRNCNSFVNDLVSEINGMYNDAVEYYTTLSKKYAMIGFEMDSGDYVTSADIHFDAMQTIKDQVNADLELIRKRMLFLGNILNNSELKIKIRDGLINFRILMRDGKKIREDLKSELERYMDDVYRLLDDHLKRIERNLDLLEIDDLYMFQATCFADIDGGGYMDIEHYYIEKGCGEPLILLHGNGENCNYFRGQIEVFAERYHVYALDTRGHGKTPRGDKPFTIRQFADDLLCFMDNHQIEKANLLGFSDGGNIAMVFAIRHPDRVNTLILNGANLNPAGIKRFIQIPIEIGYRIARKFSDKSDSARLNSEMLGLMVNDPNVEADELKAIQARTLVIVGTRDMILESHTRLIAECIPDSQLVFINGSHFIANKNPEEFNRAVLKFLNKSAKNEK